MVACRGGATVLHVPQLAAAGCSWLQLAHVTRLLDYASRFGHSRLPFFCKELLQASEADPPAGAPRPVPQPRRSPLRPLRRPRPAQTWRTTPGRTPSTPRLRLCDRPGDRQRQRADVSGVRRVGAVLSSVGRQHRRGGVRHPAGRGGHPERPRPAPAAAWTPWARGWPLRHWVQSTEQAFPGPRPHYRSRRPGVAARFSLRRILVFTVSRGYQDTFDRARLDRSLPGFRVG